MSDLAKAAGSGTLFDVGDGKKIELCPLTAKDLGALEIQSLQLYKRRYIKTFKENLDLIDDPAKREGAVMAAIERAAKMDLDSLPTHEVDIGTADKPQMVRVPYTGHWMTTTFEGMLCMFWYSARKANPQLTYDEAADVMAQAGIAALREATSLIDQLSSPPSGNSQQPSLVVEATAAIETPLVSDDSSVTSRKAARSRST